MVKSTPVNQVVSCTVILPHLQCDQIEQFIALWVTFQSLWQQLFCPNCPYFWGIFCKDVKIFHFLFISFLGNFYRHLATFYWSHRPLTTWSDTTLHLLLKDSMGPIPPSTYLSDPWIVLSLELILGQLMANVDTNLTELLPGSTMHELIKFHF